MRPLSAMECFRLKAGSCHYKPAGIQHQRKLMAMSAQSSMRSGSFQTTVNGRRSVVHALQALQARTTFAGGWHCLCLGLKAIRLEDEDPFINLYRAAHSGQTSIVKPTDPIDCVAGNAVIIYIGQRERGRDRDRERHRERQKDSDRDTQRDRDTQTDRRTDRETERVGSFMNTTSVFTIWKENLSNNTISSNSDQSGLSSRWPLLKVVCHNGSLSSK